MNRKSSNFEHKKITITDSEPLVLDSGVKLYNVEIAYETFGELNEDKSNAILICHALTGDQYVIGEHPLTKKSGWWETLIGKNKSIDTEKYYVICSNVLGGCMGSTGPLSINPENGEIYGLSFPVITIWDMVKAQRMFIDKLGIQNLLCVVGGSMGGMQALAWSLLYPHTIKGALIVASAGRHTAQNIAFHEVGRQAIMADPNWHQGTYFNENTRPTKGLSVARMTAHITYLSERALTQKFGRDLQERKDLTYTFDADFQVESYLRHQGMTFVDRFDANSYLYLTRAMDYFDISTSVNYLDMKTDFGGLKHCIISFTSDWLFPTSESRKLVHQLNSKGGKVSFVEIESAKGHDAFLLDEPELYSITESFLESLEK